jgi:predicted enzyme related to lactoylglutathione lyase
MSHPVVHFEINGSDGAKLQKFYADLFGWKIDANNPMKYGLVDNGGEGINGGIGESPQGKSLTFYVQADDPQAVLDKAQQLGGTVAMPVTTLPGMATFAHFLDPEGNLVGIVASQTPPAQ